MTDTTVKIFNSTMPGAPVLSGTAGSLIALLDACLINGFGLKTLDNLAVSAGVATATVSTGHSAQVDGVILIAGATPAALNGEQKVTGITTTTVQFAAPGVADGPASGTITVKLAPAGWTKAFTGTHLAAYRSGNVEASGCCLRIDDTAACEARVLGYEAMTDITTGSGVFPDLAGGYYWGKSDAADSASREWWLIANGRMVYLGVAHHISFSMQYVVNAFGDLKSRKSADAYRFIVTGYRSSYYSTTLFSNYSSCVYQSSASQCALPRNYTQLGGMSYGYPIWWGPNTISGSSGGWQYPNGADNGLWFSAIQFLEATSKCLRGTLPGIYATGQNLADGLTAEYLVTNVPELPGRKLLTKSIGSYSGDSRGYCWLDITGPWDA